MALGDRDGAFGSGAAEFVSGGGTEGVGAAGAAGGGGGGMGVEKAVVGLGGVGDAGETADEVLHNGVGNKNVAEEREKGPEIWGLGKRWNECLYIKWKRRN